MKTARLSALFLALVWLGLSLACWCKPADTVSQSERRPLAQTPALTGETLLSGQFAAGFEKYTVDQFPWRDGFRTVKALSQLGLFVQKGNNGIYLANGYAAQINYPLSESSVVGAARKLTALYEAYCEDQGGKILLSVVPDKGYYLAAENGYPAMDYEKLFSLMRQEMPFAAYVDLTDTLSYEDYYKTDTHWRQECLLPTAEKLAAVLGVNVDDNLTAEETDGAFYGVYYGQSALPLPSERITLMNSPTLDGCTVTQGESGATAAVYDREKLASRDPYEVYLSGASPVVTIDNPANISGRRLVIFRDSFGSSLAPLLVSGYSQVVLADTRYIAPALLGQYVDFTGADVLFLYSTLILNNSATLK